jgi:hypothetical protein
VVTLTQAQGGDPFDLPLDIGVSLDAGATRVEHADLSARSGRFVFALDREPVTVDLDPDVRLLFDGRLTRVK